MAEKDSKPKSTSKATSTTKPATAAKTAPAKPAAKTATAKAAAPAKPAAKTAAPKAEAKPEPKTAAKTTAAPKAKTEPKPAAKPATTKAAKPAEKAAAPAKSEPKSAAKPVAQKTEKPAATKATAKPVAEAKPAAKPAPKTESAKKSETAAAAAVAAPKSAAKSSPKEQPEKIKPAASTTNKKEKSKPAKQKTKKAKSDNGGKKGGAAALTANKKRIIAIAVVAFVMILALVIGISLGVRSCSNRLPVYGDEEFYDIKSFNTSTTVGYSAQTTGKVTKNKPVTEVRNESAAFDSAATGNIFANGAARYPTYGSTLSSVIDKTGDAPDVLAAKTAARSAIIAESGYLCAWGTAGANRGGEQTPDKYTKIDKDGYLYQKKDGEWIHSLLWGKTEYAEANYRQLYKHTAAQGMYLEGKTKNGVTYEISDDAERVVKEVYLRPRGYSSYSITGLYAPAGEVIKIEISGKDMNATNGISVHIGQALYNGQANNIWASKNQMQRFPYLLTTLALTKDTCEYDEATDTYTGYVGSFIGGPIYIRNTNANFTAKISGGVEYLHFILGYTTEKEFNRLKTNSRVPMFDLEVWNYGVLHSGPRYYAEPFSYEDLYKAAVLWDKVANVTTTNGTKQGIVFLYDPFVAAGAAVAFPGRSSVNCPAGWMSQSLNYEGLITSGSWGNFHEYHHNFQNYGLGSGGDGEVTNNALNLVSYSLFTKISSKRGMGSYGSQGLGGWNNYTSAPWVIQRVNAEQITSTNGLAVYATLLHNFGQDAFIKARGVSGPNKYFDKWATLTHQDMTYYASLSNTYYNGGSNAYTPSEAVVSANYPLFVPVASVYQTGRSYMYDGAKRDIKTMQPYVIPYGKEFTVDLRPYTAPGGQYASGSVVIGKGFEYTIKDVTQPENGKLEKTSVDGVYTYTPDKNGKQLRSGQIRVTLGITATDSNYASKKIDDVDLIIEFEQSHETNKMILERTTYTYTAATMYKDAVEAYEKGFKGSETVVEQDQFNPTQNCNTDIWFYPESERQNHPNDPDKYFFHENNVEVIDGKLYFDDDGKYRVYLRGRNNCALYFSLDGKDYTLGAKITASTPVYGNATANFRLSAPDTYFDVQFDEGSVTVTLNVNGGGTKNFTLKLKEGKKEIENWLFIKEVLIVEPSARSFIGVGMTQWTQAMFTIQEEYFTSDNKAVENTEAEGYAYTKTTYKNYVGIAIAYTKTDKKGKTEYFKQSGEKIDAKAFSEMTESKLMEPTSANYVNAYRSTYDFKAEFTSEYFYKRSYGYDYKDNVSVPKDEVSVTATNYTATGWGKGMPIENISDGKTNTYIHTSWEVTAKKPLDLTFDLGAERNINRITFQCRNNNGMLETPKAFTVEGSLDGNTWFNVTEYTNAPRNGNVVNADFEDTTLRYCRIKISAAHQGNGSYYIVIGEITFTHSTEVLGGKQFAPDNEMFTYKGKWSGAQTASSFGHVAIGASGAKVTFEFTGTRIALLSSNAYGKDFKVSIDGKKVDSVALKEDNSPYCVSYMCDKLAQGKHKVVVTLTGKSTIDSVITFDEGE